MAKNLVMEPYNLRSKGHHRQNSETESRGHNVAKYGSVLEVLTEIAHYKGSFWGAIV